MSGPISGGAADGLVPGQVIPGEEPVELNPGRARTTVTVVNTGDRPIQVGSHYHFPAANPALAFDRDAAWGHRLDVPAGTAIRFEPGVSRDVDLVPLAGNRIVPGLRMESAGALDAPAHGALDAPAHGALDAPAQGASDAAAQGNLDAAAQGNLDAAEHGSLDV